MAVTEEFKQAVVEEKRIRIRIMLKDSMLVDPTMRQFDEMLDFALSNMSDLYDVHDDEVLEYDRTKWNEDYLNKEMVSVVNNFSKERVELLRNIVKHLYRDKAANISNERDSKSSITRKQVGMGVTATGAAVTIAGICASEGAIIAGGIVIAAVGVALIVSDRGNN